jgi:hypothetical protein
VDPGQARIAEVRPAEVRPVEGRGASAAWQKGTARWPDHVDLDELREADWHAPETRSPEEVQLCERIAKRLVMTSGYRYLTRDDGVGEAPAGCVSSTSRL